MDIEDRTRRAQQVHNGMIAGLARVQWIRRRIVRDTTPDPVWLGHELAKVEDLMRSVNALHSTLLDGDRCPDESTGDT